MDWTNLSVWDPEVWTCTWVWGCEGTWADRPCVCGPVPLLVACWVGPGCDRDSWNRVRNRGLNSHKYISLSIPQWHWPTVLYLHMTACSLYSFSCILSIHPRKYRKVPYIPLLIWACSERDWVDNCICPNIDSFIPVSLTLTALPVVTLDIINVPGLRLPVDQCGSIHLNEHRGSRCHTFHLTRA